MERVAVEKQSVTRIEFDIDQLQHFHSFLRALGVRAGLLAITAMLNAPHQMRAFEDLHAPVLPRVRIDRDTDRCQVGKKATVLIPISIILMPGPGPAGVRLFDAHLGMVMVNLVPQQLLHGIDDTMTTGYRAIDILAGLIPKNELGRAAFP